MPANYNMPYYQPKYRNFILLSLLVSGLHLCGQGVTRVSGNIYDASTKEAIPFANVSFRNTNVGTVTDLDGFFEIESRFVSDSLCASFLGFTEQCIKIARETRTRDIVFNLEQATLQLTNVVISAQKTKYTKKDNPAVELMRKVINNKKQNRLEGQDYYSFDQYEKVQLDLNNITTEFKNRKIFNDFDILWQYLDTSTVNGKIFLPMYLLEKRSKVYYRRDPESRKEYRYAVKKTDFDSQIDDQSVTDALDFLYKDINIYDNVIPILDNNFISPISPLALNFYRFYILDTLIVNNTPSIRLGFIPRNQTTFGFTGDLFVSNDSLYRVVKADFGIIGNINLNFINDLKVKQEFEPLEGAFVLSRDELVIDYSITKNGIGLFGTRSVAYDRFKFDREEDESVYSATEKVIDVPGLYRKDEAYWTENRIVPLTENQTRLYEMLDTLTSLPAYKRLVTGVKIVTTGFIPLKGFDIGPLPTFISFNPVEGTRIRMGFETNFDFNKNLLLAGYAAYGFRDGRMKYRAAATYSFRENFRQNPRHYIRVINQQDVSFPGLDLQFFQNDNLLLSVRRGAANKMLFFKESRIEYSHETPALAVDLVLNTKATEPYGDLKLMIEDGATEPRLLDAINTTSIGLGLEFAPNKQFIQGRQYRAPLINEYPIFNLRYAHSFRNILGGDFNSDMLELGFFKRFNMSILGHNNIGIEAGKIWGAQPYTTLFIPRANQSFAYERASFNLMNFLEFVSDSYVFIRSEHFFKGFIFNRLPLIKKLGLRELMTFKLIYGGLSERNDPERNKSLPKFDTRSDGQPATFTFYDGPYMEGSVGISNIFKVLRIDLVKRFNYLEHPDVPELFGVKGLGLRARFKVEF